MSKGNCGLTGQHGKFVKCHLIPKALTKPTEAGLPFIQGGTGHPTVQRWSSWYDKRLVTRQGEDIFSNLDDWAIKFFRNNKMVWSGWGPLLNIDGLQEPIENTGLGIRTIEVPNPDKLRLFVLSLLWRAAATSRPEFSDVKVPDEELEIIRKALLTNKPPDISFYPAMITQLSSRGLAHNLTPVAREMPLPNFEVDKLAEPPSIHKVFRFYFDGLIINIHRDQSGTDYATKLESLIVGFADKILLSTVRFENSFERANLLLNMKYSRNEGMNRRK